MAVDVAATGTQLVSPKPESEPEPEPEPIGSSSKEQVEGDTTISPNSNHKQASKKPRKQHGAKGKGRMQKLTFTEVENHFPETCAICGLPHSNADTHAYTRLG